MLSYLKAALNSHTTPNEILLTILNLSEYIEREENHIEFKVAVDKPEDDSDDNRRAYILRYTAATDLFHYLPLDQYQYVMGHHRSTTGRGAETGDARVYSSPQIQREIYL